jgi:gamma-glutamyltranspeptidase
MIRHVVTLGLAGAAWPITAAGQTRSPSTLVTVEGRNGMVIGTTGAPAVREGARVLREGGTAVDAALTTNSRRSRPRGRG